MGRVGIIAGGGSLPARLIQACTREHIDYFVLALKGQTDPNLVKNKPHAWVSLGQTQAAISLLKKEQVDRVVLGGAVRRPSLHEMKPDLRTIKAFARLGLKGIGDDTLLRLVRDELEKEGLRIIGAHEIEPSLLTPMGVLTHKKPTVEHNADIAHGAHVARALGALDVGQGAVVQQGIVLGLEAVEGTDALLQRCKSLRRKGRGGILVKMKKPQQDICLDLPAIGLRTVRLAYEAGLEGIAAQAGATLMLEREETIEAANKLGLFIVGIDPS